MRCWQEEQVARGGGRLSRLGRGQVLNIPLQCVLCPVPGCSGWPSERTEGVRP